MSVSLQQKSYYQNTSEECSSDVCNMYIDPPTHFTLKGKEGRWYIRDLHVKVKEQQLWLNVSLLPPIQVCCNITHHTLPQNVMVCACTTTFIQPHTHTHECITMHFMPYKTLHLYTIYASHHVYVLHSNYIFLVTVTAT